MRRVGIKSLSLLGLLAWATTAAMASANPCGLSPSDWCTSAADGDCGRHLTEEACRADSQCRAMTYQGESAVACHWDARGFADNCPAVGCLHR